LNTLTKFYKSSQSLQSSSDYSRMFALG